MRENTLNNGLSRFYLKGGRYIHILAICCLIFAFGCKAKKQLIVTKPPPVADTVVKAAADPRIAKLNAIKAGQTVFSTFSGKARTKLNIGGETNDVTLNIRIKSGQKIWVSITAIAGLEVARALITPDSLFLINRLQSLYLKKPFSYVNKYAGDQVNYKTLESLLIGNAIPELVNDSTKLEMENGNSALSGNLSGMLYKIIVSPDIKIQQTNLSNQAAGQSLQVTNTAFIPAGSRVMPTQIDMSSTVGNKKILVNLRYIKEEFETPVDFPFSIPGRYTPAE
jgi:hypothetical protein